MRLHHPLLALVPLLAAACGAVVAPSAAPREPSSAVASDPARASASPRATPDDRSSSDAASLAALVLQEADLDLLGETRAFRRFDEGPLAQADTPPPPRDDPRRFGRQGGWKARYKRADAEANQGVLVIESRVDAFADEAGAVSDLEAYREQYRRASDESGGKVVEALVGGDGAVALEYEQPAVMGSLRYSELAWRTGRFTGSILLSGYGGAVSSGQAVELAEAVRARMAQAADVP